MVRSGVSRVGNGMKSAGRLLPILAIGYAAGSYEARAQQGAVLNPIRGKNGVPTGVSVGIGYDRNGKPQAAVSGPGLFYIAPEDKKDSQDNQQTPQQQNHTREQPDNERCSISMPVLWKDLDGNGKPWDNDGKLQVIELDTREPKKNTRGKIITLIKNLKGEEIVAVFRPKNGEPKEFRNKVPGDDSCIHYDMGWDEQPWRVEIYCPKILGTKPAWREFKPED